MSTVHSHRSNRSLPLSLPFLCLLHPFSFADELGILLNLTTTLYSPDSGVFSSWTPDKPLCSFAGVTCKSDGSVLEIDLSGKQLSGVPPLDSICELKSLEKLAFGVNSLQGTLSRGLDNCVALRYLDLGNNQFAGPVPDISSLVELRYLYLNNSGFSGAFPWNSLKGMTNLIALSIGDNPFRNSLFPEQVLSLRNLNWLYMSNCSIGGEIPPSIGGLTKLIDLELADNNITGEIPAEIGNLTNLWQLELYSNSLIGKLPTGLRNLTKLEFFDASINNLDGDLSELRFLTNLVSLQLFMNGFSGKVPDEFGEFRELVNLSLYTNKLTGPLPLKLGSQAEFEFIDLSENFLTGSIPPDMCKQGKLKGLLMLQNNLTGEIPETYSYRNCPSLTRFRVSNNSLSGSIPQGIWWPPANAKSLGSPGAIMIDLAYNNFDGPVPIPPPTAQFYIVSNNMFSRDIPDQICGATQLKLIDLSNNRLTGIIPHCLINLNASLVLDLRANNFVGQIPEIFTAESNLQTICLSQNRLRGTLPRSLARCKNLEILDISENELEGSFPYWLETLPNLQVLDLRSNKFSGPLNWSKRTNPPFPKLRIFDLSDNGFWGELPTKYIANLMAMKNVNRSGLRYMGGDSSYQASVVVIMKGLKIELVKILTVFTTIDFSSNFFQGEIPEIIGDLKGLKGLNFSHNNLSGRIPSSMGNLTELEWLDLSSNKLRGEIPSGLADLTWLSSLSLSGNQLVGPIPRGPQFDTFGHSFDGNPGLCGHPLPRACESDAGQAASSNSHDEWETESGNGIEWRVVLMGYGFGLAPGIWIGYIMLETWGPRWLARKIERQVRRKTNRRKRNVSPRNHGR